MSKYIPPAYTRAEQRFWNEVSSKQMLEKVELREWGRDDWTYHAKGSSSSRISQRTADVSGHPTGIWLSAAEDPSRPFATVIGSSNYGPRSAARDVEANLLVTTTNTELKEQLGREVERIRAYTEIVNASTFERPERRVGLGVRFAAWCIKDML